MLAVLDIGSVWHDERELNFGEVIEGGYMHVGRSVFALSHTG